MGKNNNNWREPGTAGGCNDTPHPRRLSGEAEQRFLVNEICCVLQNDDGPLPEHVS